MIIPIDYVVKFFKALFPMIQETFTDSSTQKWLKANPGTVLCIISILVLGVVCLFLREQATQNLYLQQPLSKKISDLQDQNHYLTGQVQSMQNDLLDSEARTQRIMSQCQDVVADPDTAYGEQMRPKPQVNPPASSPNLITVN